MSLKRRTLALLGLLVVGGPGLAACADILGIQDRSLDPEAGGGPVTCTTSCPMAAGLNQPWAIAADESNVYWTELGDLDDTNGSVKACPVTGCAGGPTVYAALQAQPYGIVIDAHNVYWGTSTSTGAGGGIWACAIGGCNGQPQKLASADAPYTLALDSQYVYWADMADNTVSRVSVSGGPATELLSTASTNQINRAQGCAVTPPFVFINDQNDDVFTAPIDGGNAVQVYTPTYDDSEIWGLTADTNTVYIGAQGAILAASKGSPSSSTSLVSNVTLPVDLALDPAGGMLYWADLGLTNSDGNVGGVPLDGGSPVLLATAVTTPHGVAVNSTQVFWLSAGVDGEFSFAHDTGVLYRVAR